MSSSELRLNVGVLYVTEMPGFRNKVYKVGNTHESVRKRIAGPTAYAPGGVRTLISQVLPDYKSGETMAHRLLSEWHIAPTKERPAKELFKAPFGIIEAAIQDIVAYQRPFAHEQFEELEILRANGFVREHPVTLLGEILDAPIAPKLSLKTAIIRAINSTSNEEKALKALASLGILIDRRARTAVVHSIEALRVLSKRKSDASGIDMALSRLSCFNAHGNPVFNG